MQKCSIVLVVIEEQCLYVRNDGLLMGDAKERGETKLTK